MRLITKDEFVLSPYKFIPEFKRKIFIYPTDTIYGIGCNATNEKLVAKIRKAKKSTQPFSIIVPSIGWIVDNCHITANAKKYLEKLPGPYTLILKLKNKKAVCPSAKPLKGTIGIRIPKHWISKLVEHMNVPLITTSANVTGDDFMTNTENLNPSVRSTVDYVLYEGEKVGRPSTIINLTEDKVKIKKR